MEDVGVLVHVDEKVWRRWRGKWRGRKKTKRQVSSLRLNYVNISAVQETVGKMVSHWQEQEKAELDYERTSETMITFSEKIKPIRKAR